VVSPDATLPLRLPEEHGAWGILLVPFLCAAAVASQWNAPLLLAGACVLSLFLLHGSLHGRTPGWGAFWMALRTPAHLLLAMTGCAAGAVLFFFYRRFQLLWLGVAAAALFWLQRWLIETHQQQRMEKRSLLAELVGVVLLTLTGPVAWIASRGSLFQQQVPGRWNDGAGVIVWLLNLLFFLGGILYVKYRVRGLLAHRQFGELRERLAFAWPVFLFHLFLAAFLAGWVAFDSLSAVGHSGAMRSAVVGLAFVPSILRAGRLLFEMGRRFPIRQLGWTEIAHAAVFGSLLILGMRLAA
jgi:hypothetical protein